MVKSKEYQWLIALKQSMIEFQCGRTSVLEIAVKFRYTTTQPLKKVYKRLKDTNLVKHSLEPKKK